MRRERTTFYATMLAVCAAAMVTLCAIAADGADFNAAIDATCRVKDYEGSGRAGTGTGFLFDIGPFQAGEEDQAWIATAAHVISTGTDVRVEFGRAGVPVRVRVLWRNPRTDGGVLVVPYRALPVPRPRPIYLAPPSVRIKVGQQLWSVGCPNGGPLMAWTGKCVGHEGGTLLFAPGPELGRSGSAILAQVGDDLRAVGILSARNSQGLNSGTIGRAVGMTDLLGQQTQLLDNPEWLPTQCGPNGCPTPQPIQPYELLPYRHYQGERDRQQNERISGLERSQGTMPLPPAITVPVPSGPDPELQKRIVALEFEDKVAQAERAELRRRADTVRDVAKELAEKYEPQLKGISGDVNAAIEASKAAGQAANSAAGLADAAKKEAEGATTKAGAVEGKVGEVAGEVAAVKKETEGLKEKLANLGGPVHDKIQDVLVARGLDPWVAGLAATGIIGVVVVVVVFLVRKDVKHRKEEGDPLAVEKLVALLGRGADLTRNPVDDRLTDMLERAVTRAADRIAPKPAANPTQPQ